MPYILNEKGESVFVPADDKISVTPGASGGDVVDPVPTSAVDIIAGADLRDKAPSLNPKPGSIQGPPAPEFKQTSASPATTASKEIDITGLEAINGAEFNTRDLQRANFTDIVPKDGTLYGKRIPQLPNQETPAVGTEPIDSNELETNIDAPDPLSYLNTNNTTPFVDKITAVADTVFTGTKSALDNLRVEQQALIQKQKDLAASQKDKAVEGIRNELNNEQAANALKEARDLFNVEENIKTLATIQQKVVDAQEALNIGLIYEEDRPARMQLITGRMATLQKQGLASIGALQGTAAVINGNLSLADAYAKSTIAALKEDSDRNISALNTLLEMADKELIALNDEERAVVNSRLEAIENEIGTGEEDQEAVIDLMKNSPKAFLDGGVTLLDTPEEALTKMLPYLADDEKRLFENKFKTGGTSVSATATKLAEEREAKGQLLQVKANGASYDEAVNAFGDILSISYIKDIYNVSSKTESPENTLKGNYYDQFIDEATGGVKEGYLVGIDADNGRLTIKNTAEDDGEGGSTMLGGVSEFFKGLGNKFLPGAPLK